MTENSNQDSDLTALKRERTSKRRLITKTINDAKTLLTDKDLNEQGVTRLKGLSKIISSKLGVIESIDSKILALVEESELEKEMDDSAKYVTDSYLCVSDIESALEKLSMKSTTTASVPALSHSIELSSTASSPASSAASSAKVKLPKIDITGVGTPNGIWFLSRAHTLHNKSYL